MKRETIDFHAVYPEHIAIHERLVNWSRCQKSAGFASSALPMFKYYRDGYHEVTVSREPPDTLDGERIQEGFACLPELHRHAIGWAYVKTWIPVHLVCRELKVRQSELANLIHEGR